MKILAFSDIHCDLEAAAALVVASEAADLVIGAGDFAAQHDGLAETMAALDGLAEKALYVPGNNETVEALAGATTAPVMHGMVLDRMGLRIAGIGCAIPPLPPLPWGSCDMSEAEAANMLVRMDSADILITHSPPHGVADVHAELGHIGSKAVRAWIEDHQPELVFCGHIHDCWEQEGMIGASRVMNLGPKGAWVDV